MENKSTSGQGRRSAFRAAPFTGSGNHGSRDAKALCAITRAAIGAVWSKYSNALRDHGLLWWTLRTNTTTCARLLAYVTGLVNQELLLENEYLAAENRILKARLQPGWRLSDGERATLAEIGKRLGRKGPAAQSRVSPNPIPFSPGIADWWPKNSMAPSSAARRAGRAPIPRSRI